MWWGAPNKISREAEEEPKHPDKRWAGEENDEDDKDEADETNEIGNKAERGDGWSQNGLRPNATEKKVTSDMRRNKIKAEVHKPSQQERKQHERTHCRFRSWRKYCVQGRGMNAQHRKKPDKDAAKEEAEVPRVSMDYFFMSWAPTRMPRRTRSSLWSTKRLVRSTQGQWAGKESAQGARWIG